LLMFQELYVIFLGLAAELQGLHAVFFNCFFMLSLSG
jgi:hypothetical protein